MEHIEDENLAIGPLFMITAVLTGITVTCFFGSLALKNMNRDNLIQAFQEQRSAASLENEAMQAERLNNYATIEKESGHYQIPIDRAMDLFIEERKAK